MHMPDLAPWFDNPPDIFEELVSQEIEFCYDE